MALSFNRDKINAYRKKQEEKAQSSGFFDDTQMKFEEGKVYKVRLLWDESDKREGPFVELYNHGGRDSQGKYKFVTCPTTFNPITGWSECPICENNKKLWERKEAGSVVDGQLYQQFKRKFNGYALVFVVSDPTNPENNGHVRKMRFTIRQKRFLDREIFGIIGKKRDDEETPEVDLDEITGNEAFDLEKGRDLIITVTKQGKFLNYDYKFAKKLSSIDADLDVLEAECNEMDLDGMLKKSSSEDVHNFYRTIVLDSSETDTVMSESKDSGMSDLDRDIEDMMNDSEESAKKEPKAETPKPAKASEIEDEEIDIDALISEIEND